MGAERMDENSVENFIGSKMVWSSFSAEENIRLVEGCGFEIIHSEEEGKEGDYAAYAC
jgi:hypothetical protein